jgi:hypothetical protein
MITSPTLFGDMSMASTYEQRTTIIETTYKENSSMAIGQPQDMFLKGTVPVGGKKDASPIGKPQRWQTEGKRDCVSTTLKNSHEPSLSTPFLP